MRLSNIKSIGCDYDHVYVSPHMDDVVLSCGGGIAAQMSKGESVLVVTVFTGNVNKEKKPRGEAFDPIINIQRRKAEDAQAMERLGVDYLWLDYVDAIFRYRVPICRYGLRNRVIGRERALWEALVSDIRSICGRAGNKRLYLPLGAGQHVDHHLSFKAGRRVDHDKSLGLDLIFYEDMPYTLFPGALIYRMRLLGFDLRSTVSEIDRTTYRSVLRDSVAFYRAIIEIPSLSLNHPLLKPFVFLSLMNSFFITIFLSKSWPNAFGRTGISPVLSDISLTLDNKMDAIAAYDSQLHDPFEGRESIRKSFAVYSQGIGGMRGQYMERYWVTA